MFWFGIYLIMLVALSLFMYATGEFITEEERNFDDNEQIEYLKTYKEKRYVVRIASEG